MADTTSQLSKTCHLVFNEGTSIRRKLKADLKGRLEERKLLEEEIKVRVWVEGMHEQADRNLLPQLTTVAGSQTGKEKQPADGVPDAEIENILISTYNTSIESTTVDDSSAEPESVRTFPPQGLWQLQRHGSRMTFTCTRCNNLNMSKFVACDVAERVCPYAASAMAKLHKHRCCSVPSESSSAVSFEKMTLSGSFL
jgi:hypothetical protein